MGSGVESPMVSWTPEAISAPDPKPYWQLSRQITDQLRYIFER